MKTIEQSKLDGWRELAGSTTSELAFDAIPALLDENDDLRTRVSELQATQQPTKPVSDAPKDGRRVFLRSEPQWIRWRVELDQWETEDGDFLAHALVQNARWVFVDEEAP